VSTQTLILGLGIYLINVCLGRRIIVKSIVLMVVFATALLLGCSNNVLVIQETTIFDESSTLKKLNNVERGFVSAMLATEDKSGIFDGKINAVNINGFRVLYKRDSGEIYIVKNGRFVQIYDVGVIIYKKDHPDSPFPVDTEQVIATDNYINYYGEDFVYHDYGYNGVDLQFSKTDENNPDYFIDNEFCTDSLATSVFAVCCRNSKHEYKRYTYSYDAGWQERSNPVFLETCRTKFEKQELDKKKSK